MRIISQDNVKDFPYEMCTIWVIENKIFASPIGEPDTEAVMAEYSTQEKGEKAMQKLHECHIGIHTVGELDDTVDCSSLSQIGIYKINENGDYAYKLPVGERIFRFPQDDEL